MLTPSRARLRTFASRFIRHRVNNNVFLAKLTADDFTRRLGSLEQCVCRGTPIPHSHFRAE